MNDTDPNQWWQIRCNVSKLESDAVEELGFALIAGLSEAGTAQDRADELSAFMRVTHEDCHARVASLKNDFDFEAIIEKVSKKNWVVASQESWEAVAAANLTIIPFLETSAHLSPARGEIRIHPGTGFGTGHHATTRMLLLFLQNTLLTANPPKTILDLGTGSAVLAIAAHRLFGVTVDAIDNDPMAIENAMLNTQLNHCSAAVNVAVGTIEDTEPQYDLIIANLYAELLIELSETITNRTVKGGTILLSGILEELWPAVEQAFTLHGCTLQSKKISSLEFQEKEPGPIWVAAHFNRDTQ